MKRYVHLLLIGLFLTNCTLMLFPISNATINENNGIFDKYHVIGTFSIKEIKGDLDYKIIAYGLIIFSYKGTFEVYTNKETLFLYNFKIYYEHTGYCNFNEDVFFAIGTCDKFYN